MTWIALLLAALLSPKDEAEIRNLILHEARIENAKPSDHIWSERLPLRYTVQWIEPVTNDVALVDVKNTREPHKLVFVVQRTDGHWTVVRKLPLSDPRGPMLIPATP